MMDAEMNKKKKDKNNKTSVTATDKESDIHKTEDKTKSDENVGNPKPTEKKQQDDLEKVGTPPIQSF